MNARHSVRTLSEVLFLGLEEQCKLRRERNRMVHNHAGKPEPEWIVREREFMHQQVNIERATLHKTAVPITDIERVESMACGHSDYTRKFAIYCAELVLLVDDVRSIKP